MRNFNQMMNKVLFILFLHITNLTYCQEIETRYKQEVKSLLNYIQLEFIGETTFNIDQSAKLVKIEDCKSTYESSIFDSSELEYIKKSIDKPKIVYWTKDFFPSSNIIESKKIQDAFKDEIDGWKKFRQIYGGSSIAEFSSPIFLRNYEIAIIKFSITSGYLSGVGYEALFIKKGNVWEINACGWDN
jgi:hypothetical protein